MLTSILLSGQVHGDYNAEVDAKINKAVEAVPVPGGQILVCSLINSPIDSQHVWMQLVQFASPLEDDGNFVFGYNI